MVRAVDLNLFVDVASKGWNDGAKVKTPFASFLDGVSTGIDQYYTNQVKAAQTAQAEQQTQIQAQQAPYELAIKQEQAAEANIKQQAMQENPDAYKASIISKLETEKKQKALEAQIQSKKTNLASVMSSGDTVAIGRALMSGEYDSIMSGAEKKEAVDNTYTGWSDVDKELLRTREKETRTRESSIAAQATAEAAYPEHVKAVESNGELNALRQKLGNISLDDFYNNGEMITIKAGKPQAVRENVEVPDPEHPGQMKIEERNVMTPLGGIKTEPNPASTELEDRNVFRYKDTNYDVGTSLSREATTTFNNARSNYFSKNNLYKGSGGITDLAAKDEEAKKAKEVAAAKAKEEFSTTESRRQSQQAQFESGAALNPKFRSHYANLRQDIADSKAERSGVPKEQGPVSALDVAVTARDSSSPMGRPAPRAGAKVAPADAAPLGPANSANTDSFPSVEKMRQREDVAKAKAEARFKIDSQPGGTKLAQGAAPQEPTPIRQQARDVTASTTIPQQVRVPGSRYKTNELAVANVKKLEKEIPDLENMPAIVKAVITAESAGNVNAKSYTNVKGVAQVTGPTGRSIKPDFDPTNPVDSVFTGATYLYSLMAIPQFKNNPVLGVVAYNGGPTVVQEAVRMSNGSTNWRDVKRNLVRAGRSQVVRQGWLNDGVKPENLDKKAIETYEYADRVLSQLQPFLATTKDMNMADNLRQQGALEY